MADPITPETVAAAFRAVGGEAALEVRRLSGGSSNPSWRVVAASGVYAVRLYAAAEPVYAQAELFRYLAEQRFPVPEVAFAGPYRAHHVLALSWLGGRTVAEALRARSDLAGPFGQTFGELHARLHAVPTTRELQGAFRPVEAGGEAGGAPVLVHLDYHLLNVLTDGLAVTGVVDWENVRLGDPRYDVARTLSILCADPAIRALPRAQRQIVRVFRRGYLEGYRRAAGPASLGALAPFLAWAGALMLDDLGGRLEPRAARTVRRWSRWCSHSR